MDSKIVIITDPDGDQLSVTPRDGPNGSANPIITVTNYVARRSQSVMIVETEMPEIIVSIVRALNLNDERIREIIKELQYLEGQ